MNNRRAVRRNNREGWSTLFLAMAFFPFALTRSSTLRSSSRTNRKSVKERKFPNSADFANALQTVLNWMKELIVSAV